MVVSRITVQNDFQTGRDGFVAAGRKPNGAFGVLHCNTGRHVERWFCEPRRVSGRAKYCPVPDGPRLTKETQWYWSGAHDPIVHSDLSCDGVTLNISYSAGTSTNNNPKNTTTVTAK